MAGISFEIAKKMPKAVKGAPGMSLRTLRMDVETGEASMVIMAESYTAVRAQLADYPLRHRTQGKTLCIFESAALGSVGGQLFAFAGELPFNTEEALDVCECLALPDKPFTVKRVELEGTTFSVKAEAQLPGAEGGLQQESENTDASKTDAEEELAQAYFDRLAPLLARYNMGVIK